MSDGAEEAWEPRPDSDEAYALFSKERRVTVDDGTPIAYTVRGAEGPAIPILFANGWSCSDAYWGRILPDLVERGHPCVLPDTRGNGLSGLPRAPGRGARNLTVDDVSMARIARDMIAVLDDAGLDRALVVGHSMGVQSALEAYRHAPDKVAGLALVAGTFEDPTKTFYGSGILHHLLPIATATMRWFPEIVRPVQSSIGSAEVGRLGARLVRAAGPKVKKEELLPYLLHIKGADLAVATLMAEAMRQHSAADLLPNIAAPTLILAAGADPFTPARCSEVMHHRIAGSELRTFPNASHTLPIEEPEAVVAAVADFAARRVQPPLPRRRRRKPAKR